MAGIVNELFASDASPLDVEFSVSISTSKVRSFEDLKVEITLISTVDVLLFTKKLAVEFSKYITSPPV